MKSFIKRMMAVLMVCLTVTGTSAVSTIDASAKSVVSETSNVLTIPFDGSPAVLQRGSSYTFPTIYSKLFPGITYKVSAKGSKVISVNDGVITANGVGTATLTVTLPGGISFSKDISVRLPEITVKLDRSSMILGEGQLTKLKAILSASGASVNWTSSNKNVLTVDQTGKISAKRSGTSVVTAKLANGNLATCVITVKSAPKTLVFDKGQLTLGLGESTKVDCQVNGRKGAYSITYTSSDPKVAEVNPQSGVITTHKTGRVVITARAYNGKTTTCILSVQQAPKTITFNRSEITLKRGDSTKLIATLPNGTSSGSLTYFASNDKIVDVKSNGLVKAIKTGTAYVCVKTYNGKTAICKVTVK